MARPQVPVPPALLTALAGATREQPATIDVTDSTPGDLTELQHALKRGARRLSTERGRRVTAHWRRAAPGNTFYFWTTEQP